MTAGSSSERESDPELVRAIVNKLKSGGSFDQFRREFIADVDTKPAYQNLQQRVESYVNRFLSQQKWSPKLNKNQLRENLRRQINQSGMLNKGVERIIEQVVNPKIMQIIKPKIDEVTCDHLGISLEERNNRLKQKQLEQQEKMMKSPESGGIASLLSLTFTSPPPGVKTPSFLNSSPPPQFTPSSSNGILGPAPPQFPPQIGFPNPPAASMPFPGLSQQTFPFMPPGWSVSMNAGFPPIFPPASQIGGPFQDFRVPPPGSGLAIPPQASGSMPPSSDGTVPPGAGPVPPTAAGPIPPAAGVILPPGAGVIPPAAGGILMPPVPMGAPIASTSTLSSNTTKPSPGKGLNALLGLPTPSEEPPPPGTVVLPDGTHIKKIWKPETQDEYIEKTEEVVMEDSYVEYKEAGDERNDVVVESEDTHVVIMDEIPLPEGTNKHADEETVGGESKRYKFAWDEDIDVGSDIEDDASSHVSSVHTSDLSNFEESNSSSDSDVEELENKLLLLQKEQDQKEEDTANNLDTTEEGGTLETDLQTEDDKTDIVQAVSHDPEESKTEEMVSAEPSPVKQPPAQPVVTMTRLEGDVTVSAKDKKELSNKPRKLLSLQYNYSDSEDDESREDRKARIAREKEERYLKRLQRRAEIEAKRKEREEEKNRLRRERLEQAKAEKEKIDKEKEKENEKEEEKTVEKEQEPDEKPTVESVVQSTEAVTEKSEAPETEEIVPKAAESEVVTEKEEPEDDTKDNEVKAELVEIESKPAEIADEKKQLEAKIEEPVEIEKVEPKEDDVGKEEEIEKDEKIEEAVVEESAIEVDQDNSKVEVKDENQQVTDKTDLKEESRNTSLNTDSSHTGDSSVHVDTSVSESASPEKKTSKQRKKTKEELKAELKEQKVLERRSRRQRIRNKRYMSDEFVFKSPAASLCQSYDETMVIEETVEMEITTDGTEPQTYEVEGGDVQLVEIPLPGDQITMETVEYDEVAMVQDGAEVVMMMDGREYLSSGVNQPQGSTDYTEGVTEYEVTSADINSSEPSRVTRSQSKFNDDIKSNSSEVSDHSLDGRKRRRRNTSQSSPGEPASKKSAQVSVREGRQLRSSDHKSEKIEPKASGSKKSYDSEDLYKPRHSFSRRSMATPPPLPEDLPPLPTEPSLPPLPPLPPPPADGDNIPLPPSSPPDSGDEKRSRRRSRSTISSGSGSRSHRDTKKSKRSRSRSLSSISSDSKVSRSRSRSKSRTRSSSRSYSRSRSRTKSSSRSRSVSRSRSRSFSSVSSNESNLSDSERERRRKARPLEDVDFGEAAKRARQDSMMIPFGPRGPAGPMGPRMPMGQMGPRGPVVPGAFPPGRGMSPIGARGPRVVGPRGWFPSPHQMGPDGSPIRQPGLSPAKPYYPPGSSTHYAQPGSSWEGTMSSRPRTSSGLYDDDYFKPDDIHDGPGKTGITERGTLYREDTSPSPPPERRPVYTPPTIYREGSLSPGITGITERGTLYREDKSPTPPGLYRGRRVERSLSPPPRPRMHRESLTPSPPPISRRRARGSRSDSFESISPSPPPIGRTRQISPPGQRSPIQRSPLQRSPVQRNTPPVLYKPRTNTADASPPSSGELTPSPPDLSQLNEGLPNTPPSPVSPHSLRSATPMFDEVQDFPSEQLSPRGSITPTPSVGSNEGMLSSPEEGALAKPSRKRPRSPDSSRSSPGEALDSPPQLRRSARHQELSEGEMSPKARRRKSSSDAKEGTSKVKTRKSKRKKSKK